MVSQNATRVATAEMVRDPRHVDLCGAAIRQIATSQATVSQGSRVVIASWPRNARETVQVALDRYQGCDTIDVRTWYVAAHGTLRPTRSGLSLSVGRLPQIAAALTLAAVPAEAQKRALLSTNCDEGGAQ